MSTELVRPQSMGERLATFLAEPTPVFGWAGASCAHWAAAWVAHAIGVQVTLPAFDDVRGALRVIEAAGGIGPAIDLAVGVPAQRWALAQIGDLMLFPTEGQGVGHALGICNGQVAAVRDAAGAVLFLPCSDAVASWSLVDIQQWAGS
jgi:hypothetical protein